jgi:hypothetical protein
VKNLLRHRRRQFYETSSAGGFVLSRVGDVEIKEKIGEGVSCGVYRATWRGVAVVLKLYKAGAIERHHRLCNEELAEYEYRRNMAFYGTPGLSRYIAKPLAYSTSPGFSCFLQEYLDGPLYYQCHRDGGGVVDRKLFDHVCEIVKLSHAAGLYDVDLHAGNFVVVTDPGGERIPKLFDFNFIPFYVHAPNPVVWFGLRLGIIGRRWRDLRKLKRFHDFRRFEKKIRLFGEPNNSAGEQQ